MIRYPSNGLTVKYREKVKMTVIKNERISYNIENQVKVIFYAT